MALTNSLPEDVGLRLLEVVSQDRFGGFAANELLEDIAAQRHPAHVRAGWTPAGYVTRHSEDKCLCVICTILYSMTNPLHPQPSSPHPDQSPTTQPGQNEPPVARVRDVSAR